MMSFLTVGDMVKLAFVNTDFYVRAQCYLHNPCFQVIYRINKKTKAKHNFTWRDVYQCIKPFCQNIVITLDNYTYIYCKGWDESVEWSIKSPRYECVSSKIIVEYEKQDSDYMQRIFGNIDIVKLEQSLPQRLPCFWCDEEFPPLKPA